jgi:hypothetical protein
MRKCQVYEIEEAPATLNAVGNRGAAQIAVCAGCQAKARDAEIWEKIREILRGQ